MKNIQAVWDESPAEQKVTGYNIYHAKAGEPHKLLAGTKQTITIIYPGQLGYVDGDTVEIAIAAVNETSESPHTIASVTLPVPIPAPTAVTGLVITLVDA